MKMLLYVVAVLLSIFALPVSAQQKVLSAIVPSDGDSHLLVTIYERNCEPTGWNATLTNTESATRGCWQCARRCPAPRQRFRGNGR